MNYVDCEIHVSNFIVTLDNLGITSNRRDKPGYIVINDVVRYFYNIGSVNLSR